MKQTGIEPATFRLQLFSEKIQDLIGVESSTIEPLLHLEYFEKLQYVISSWLDPNESSMQALN